MSSMPCLVNIIRYLKVRVISSSRVCDLWCLVRKIMEKDRRENMRLWNRDFLGVAIVVVKSFARIHETNLKKQGMLAFTFANPSDYDLVRQDDQIDLLNLADMTPGEPYAHGTEAHRRDK